MGKTTIEWTSYFQNGKLIPGYTFNPFWGCCKISPGCENCYAETWAKRTGFSEIWGFHKVRRHFGEKHWQEPLKWNAKAIKEGVIKLVFCGSMCDIFENNPVDDVAMHEDRRRLFEVIENTDNLFWLLLTKRLENVMIMTPWHWEKWPENVAIGASIENQNTTEVRIPALLQIPAKFRFLSIEPLIDHVDLENNLDWLWEADPLEDGEWRYDPRGDIHWVIVGGESGPRSRPMNLDWVRDLREQCFDAQMPFFVKQLGTHWARSEKVYAKSKKGENKELWPEDLRIQQIPRQFTTRDRFPAP